MAIIEILTTIVTGIELVSKIKEVSAPPASPFPAPPAMGYPPFDSGSRTDLAPQVAEKIIPTPAKELKDKNRWIQCTLKNETQFDVLLLDTYFDSGRYWTSPGGFGPFQQMAFTACNGDNTIFTGATGGTAFRLSLDDKHYYDFSLVSNSRIPTNTFSWH